MMFEENKDAEQLDNNPADQQKKQPPTFFIMDEASGIDDTNYSDFWCSKKLVFGAPKPNGSFKPTKGECDGKDTNR